MLGLSLWRKPRALFCSSYAMLGFHCLHWLYNLCNYMLPRPAQWAPGVTVLSELLILHEVAEETCVQLVKHSNKRCKMHEHGDHIIIPFLCTLQYTKFYFCWHEHWWLCIHLCGTQAALGGIKIRLLQMQWTDAVWTVQTHTDNTVCMFMLYTLCLYIVPGWSAFYVPYELKSDRQTDRQTWKTIAWPYLRPHSVGNK